MTAQDAAQTLHSPVLLPYCLQNGWVHPSFYTKNIGQKKLEISPLRKQPEFTSVSTSSGSNSQVHALSRSPCSSFSLDYKLGGSPILLCVSLAWWPRLILWQHWGTNFTHLLNLLQCSHPHVECSRTSHLEGHHLVARFWFAWLLNQNCTNVLHWHSD